MRCDSCVHLHCAGPSLICCASMATSKKPRFPTSMEGTSAMMPTTETMLASALQQVCVLTLIVLECVDMLDNVSGSSICMHSVQPAFVTNMHAFER